MATDFYIKAFSLSNDYNDTVLYHYNGNCKTIPNINSLLMGDVYEHFSASGSEPGVLAFTYNNPNTPYGELKLSNNSISIEPIDISIINESLLNIRYLMEYTSGSGNILNVDSTIFIKNDELIKIFYHSEYEWLSTSASTSSWFTTDGFLSVYKRMNNKTIFALMQSITLTHIALQNKSVNNEPYKYIWENSKGQICVMSIFYNRGNDNISKLKSGIKIYSKGGIINE